MHYKHKAGLQYDTVLVQTGRTHPSMVCAEIDPTEVCILENYEPIIPVAVVDCFGV